MASVIEIKGYNGMEAHIFTGDWDGQATYTVRVYDSDDCQYLPTCIKCISLDQAKLKADQILNPGSK